MEKSILIVERYRTTEQIAGGLSITAVQGDERKEVKATRMAGVFIENPATDALCFDETAAEAMFGSGAQSVFKGVSFGLSGRTFVSLWEGKWLTAHDKPAGRRNAATTGEQFT